jgi:hypothetical protein
LQRTFKYASLLRISGALHLGIFGQPEKNEFFNRLLNPDFIRIKKQETAPLSLLFKAFFVYNKAGEERS